MDLIITGGQWPEALDHLLRELPEWFGIEQAIDDYVEEGRSLPTTAAFHDGEVVGLCVIRQHTAVAAEIEVLAVRPFGSVRGIRAHPRVLRGDRFHPARGTN